MYHAVACDLRDRYARISMNANRFPSGSLIVDFHPASIGSLQPGSELLDTGGLGHATEPVTDERGKQLGLLVDERVAGILDDRHGGARVQLEQI